MTDMALRAMQAINLSTPVASRYSSHGPVAPGSPSMVTEATRAGEVRRLTMAARSVGGRKPKKAPISRIPPRRVKGEPGICRSMGFRDWST